MLIKNIEQRIKINKIVSIASIAFASFIVIAGFFFAFSRIPENPFIFWIMGFLYWQNKLMFYLIDL